MAQQEELDIELQLTSCIFEDDHKEFSRLIGISSSDDALIVKNILHNMFKTKMYDVCRKQFAVSILECIVDITYMKKLNENLSHLSAVYKYITALNVTDIATIIQNIITDNSEFRTRILCTICKSLLKSAKITEHSLFDPFMSEQNISILYDSITQCIKMPKLSMEQKNKIMHISMYVTFAIKDKILQSTPVITYLEFLESDIIDIYRKLYAHTLWYVFSQSLTAFDTYKKFHQAISANPSFGIRNNGVPANFRKRYDDCVKYFIGDDFISKLVDLIFMFFECIDNLYSPEPIAYILDLTNVLIATCYTQENGDKLKRLTNLLPIIIDGIGGRLTNPHLRSIAVDITEVIVTQQNSFTPFAYTIPNLQHALLNYMKDVKYTSWSSITLSLKHTKRITVLLNEYKLVMKDAFYKFVDTQQSTKYFVKKMDVDMMIFTLLIKLGTTLDDIDEILKNNEIPYPAKISLLPSFAEIIDIMLGIISMAIDECTELSPDIMIVLNMTFSNVIKVFMAEEKNGYMNIKPGTLYYTILRAICNILGNLAKTKRLHVRELNDDMLTKLIQITNANNDTKRDITEYIESPEYANNIYTLDDIPEDYLDPIFAIPTKNPIMLPGNQSIFDRDSVIINVRKTGQNPMSRDPITLEELLRYNDTDDIKNKLDDHKKKFDEYFSRTKL